MLEKVLEGGYAAFDSSSGWMTRPQYLQCKVISLPIAFAEQVRSPVQFSECWCGRTSSVLITTKMILYSCTF